MTILLKHFNELTTQELYAILQLRMEVFIMEQNCHYMDCDDRDLLSQHLMFYDNDILIAYCRIIPPDIAYPGKASIGRVATKLSHRKEGYGKKLMMEAIRHADQLYKSPIKISAQSYLLKFYEELGFVIASEEYLEDNIPHHAMIKSR